MNARYWQNFLLGASGLIVILYVGRKLSDTKPPAAVVP